MKTLTLESVYLLLLLLLWLDRCEGLNDSSLPAIFFPFGSDEGDSIAPPADDNCARQINNPYRIFNRTRLYVRLP